MSSINANFFDGYSVSVDKQQERLDRRQERLNKRQNRLKQRQERQEQLKKDFEECPELAEYRNNASGCGVSKNIFSSIVHDQDGIWHAVVIDRITGA